MVLNSSHKESLLNQMSGSKEPTPDISISGPDPDHVHVYANIGPVLDGPTSSPKDHGQGRPNSHMSSKLNSRSSKAIFRECTKPLGYQSLSNEKLANLGFNRNSYNAKSSSALSQLNRLRHLPLEKVHMTRLRAFCSHHLVNNSTVPRTRPGLTTVMPYFRVLQLDGDSRR